MSSAEAHSRGGDLERLLGPLANLRSFPHSGSRRAEAAYDLRLALEQRIALQALGKIGNGPIVNVVRLDAVRRSIGEKARQARPLISVADPLKQSKPSRHQGVAASTAHDFGACQRERSRQ